MRCPAGHGNFSTADADWYSAMTEDSKMAPAFEPTGFVELRTALLPFQVLVDWVGDAVPERPTNSGNGFSSARAALVRYLRTLLDRAEVQESLFVASPQLYHEVYRWLNNPDRPDQHLERTLVRYIQRMAGRATPFGLFAGRCTGSVSTKTSLSVPSIGDCRRCSRLDTEYLFALTHHLNTLGDVRRRLEYWPNSTLYMLGGRWRYVQTVFLGGSRHDNLVELDADELLVTLLNRASRGASIDALIDCLLAIDNVDPIDRSEAEHFVHALIDQQVLVSTLCPAVTGSEALVDLIDQLIRIGGDTATRVGAELHKIHRALRALDSRPVGSMVIDAYERIIQAVAAIGVEPDPSRLFHVDLMKPSPSATCGEDVIADVTTAVQILSNIAPNSSGDPLRRFRDAFRARYEMREVALCEVLDDECGIGLESGSTPEQPLLKGIPFPSSAAGPVGAFGPREAFLASRLEQTKKTGSTILELSHDDIQQLSSARPATLPDTFAAFAVVIDGSREGEKRNGHLLIRYVAGPSGVNIMGRFCHADPELHERVRSHIRNEESLRPDAIFAEVVHLPSGRLGNVVSRPSLRQFEIPYLGRCGVSEPYQIPISDLFVSVVNDRVVLRSARLGRQVIPRLTNMHNFRRGQPIYRFLCMLQGQGVTQWLSWHWGALEQSSFLPRVVFKRIVLSRAQWKLSKQLLGSLSVGSTEDSIRMIQQWRNENGCPRFVALVDADNELPVDFENVLSLEVFIHAVKKREQALLTEMLPQCDALSARSPEGNVVHELIIPFVRRGIEPRNQDADHQLVHPKTRRTFAPGSEWLYLKLYSGIATVDRIITEVVRDFISDRQKRGAISRWFFVRYGDPDWHLRLRLFGSTVNLQETLCEMASQLEGAIHSGHVWKVQVDTYVREIERYGGDEGMAVSEEIFWRDSEAVTELLTLLPGDSGLDARWRIGLLSWDMLLSDLGFDLADKIEFTGSMREDALRAMDERTAMKRALGARFRQERKQLESLFDWRDRGGGGFLEEAIAVLRNRSARLGPAMDLVRSHFQDGRMSIPRRAFAASHLHMHANRLLRSSHRQQEFVMHDFLNRLYVSSAARADQSSLQC